MLRFAYFCGVWLLSTHVFCSKHCTEVLSLRSVFLGNAGFVANMATIVSHNREWDVEMRGKDAILQSRSK